MSVAEQPIPEVLSEHQPDGAQSESMHLAVVPLPFVAGPHPDDALLGLALVLPRGLDDGAHRVVMQTVGRLERGVHVEQSDDPVEVAVHLDLGIAGSRVLKRVWVKTSACRAWVEQQLSPLRRRSSTAPLKPQPAASAQSVSSSLR